MAAVRGKVMYIHWPKGATGQGATFGFGLTPALSRQREREYIKYSSLSDEIANIIV